MNASKMWKNDQVPGDDCTQKIPYLKCHEKFEKINSSHNTKGQLISKCLFCVFNFLQKTNENKST